MPVMIGHDSFIILSGDFLSGSGISGNYGP